MSSAFLPPNEPPTDLTSDHIREQILSEIEKARETCEDVPIVIGGTEYKTDNVKYQVVVSVFICCSAFMWNSVLFLWCLKTPENERL